MCLRVERALTYSVLVGSDYIYMPVTACAVHIQSGRFSTYGQREFEGDIVICILCSSCYSTPSLENKPAK